MPQWMKDQLGTVSFVAGALAYAFTNFATAKYVDDKDLALEKRQDRIVTALKVDRDNSNRRLERMDDKLDRVLFILKGKHQ